MACITKKLIQNDVDILRRLGTEKAQIASLAIHKEKAKLWCDLNDKKKTRPLIFIDEIPWHEMNYNDELTILCQDEWAQQIELVLRREIYQWKHMPGDMIVSNYISCPIVINDTGFGLTEDVDIVKTDNTSDVVSRHFHEQISKPEDIEKITMPVISCDHQTTQENYENMRHIFANILPVKKEGIKHIWYTPWDSLVRWWNMEKMMMDLILRPQMVHDIYERMVDNCMSRLEQLEAQGLLTLANNNIRVGSGGYAYTNDLPSESADEPAKPSNMWGCSNAQIFSEVSPEMQWEFAVKHDLRWLEKWGLTYYGCCEPLDGKMDILRKIPNLRKISMSPWINIDNAVKQVGNDYVFSYKPSPALLAETKWDPKKVRCDLKDILEKTKDCYVEVILKDISTVRYEPQRLWEFAEIITKLAVEYE